MIAWLGVGTQIDGLGHFGIGHRYYNGLPLADFWRSDGLVKLAIHDLPPIVTRGVLLDIAALKGVEMLPAGAAVNRKELEAAMKRQKVTIGQGDVVILNTGWQRLASSDPKRFMEGEPGLGLEGARFLAEKRVVAVGADSWGLDVVPGEDETIVFPVHQELLGSKRHLHPREHSHRRVGGRQRVGVPLRARGSALRRRRADGHQPSGDPLRSGSAGLPLCSDARRSVARGRGEDPRGRTHRTHSSLRARRPALVSCSRAGCGHRLSATRHRADGARAAPGPGLRRCASPIG